MRRLGLIVRGGWGWFDGVVKSLLPLLCEDTENGRRLEIAMDRVSLKTHSLTLPIKISVLLKTEFNFTLPNIPFDE
jgi:hypothetical protein